MKLLLIAEQHDGTPSDHVTDLVAFAHHTGAEYTMFLAGKAAHEPHCKGILYVCAQEECEEYTPACHKDAILSVAAKEQPDMIVFLHSSYGWDLAPRVAYALKTACISGVTDYAEGEFTTAVYNGKLHKKVRPAAGCTVLTIQQGSFHLLEPYTAPHALIKVRAEKAPGDDNITFHGYEDAPEASVDLQKAEVIVSAGNGIANPDSIAHIKEIAQQLGGEHGATRPVVDAKLMPHERQIGITGQRIAPKLHLSCGVSGAIQHTNSIKAAKHTIAINKDPNAPIREIADIFVLADAEQLLPIILEKLKT